MMKNSKTEVGTEKTASEMIELINNYKICA